MKKILFIIGTATTLCSTAATSQVISDTTVVERNINIEKEYIPELSSVKRRNIDYTIQEQNIKKSDIVYSNYASDVQPQHQFYPLDPTEQKLLNRKSPKKGFAAAGFGYPVNWIAEIFYPILSTSNTYLDIHADHDGFIKQNIKLIDTDIDMLLKQKIGRSDEFFAAIGYKNDYYTYYGKQNQNLNANRTINDTTTVPWQSVHRAGILLGSKSLKDRQGWQYNANIGYNMMYLQTIGTAQHTVNINGYINKAFGNNSLGIGITFNGNFYEISDINHPKPVNNSVLGLTPSYNMSWSNLDLTVGAKIMLSFNKGAIVNAMPDVKVNYNIGKFMNVYGGITGKYKINTMSSLMEECRYFDPYQNITYNSYTPANIFAGFQIKPVTGLILDIHADYDYTINDMSFYSASYIGQDGTLAYSNMFTVGFANYHHLNAGIRINYNYKNLYVAHSEFSYNYYDKTMLNRPTFEWNIGTEIIPAKEWMIYGNFSIGTGYYGGQINIHDNSLNKIDLKNRYILNLGTSYTIKKQYTLFARINNILSLAPALRYQDWYGYDNFGFECIIGAKISF